ncbi:G protein-coupled receptor 139 [Mytilus galloprovincialis]|uniref:G protein-coupled receptor 139 n=2 Tax=Mytilus galloprovincialis TaxID=29158 RepID=A0A8B6BNA2_MYTGA|nr:G protein-coupled receptor 139 [Mytilus galloprovincialis]
MMQILVSSAMENNMTVNNFSSSSVNNSRNYHNIQYCCEDDSDQRQFEHVVNTYVPPVLIILGTFGNVCTLLVMRTRPFRHYPIGFYISAYALTSLLTLYLFLGSEWVALVAEKPSIDSQADWICRLWQFVSRVVTYSSIWFVVSMTIDRYITIWHRKKSSKICTLFMAKFATISIFIGLIVVSVHAMWTYELMDGCFFFHNDDDLHVVIWPWMSASCYSFIPLALIITFDILIFMGLGIRNVPDETDNEMTPMVLTHATLVLSMFYFLLVLPPTVINIVDQTYPPSWLQQPHFRLQLAKARVIGHYMAWTNTVIVFYICILFSQTFRKQANNMLKSLIFSKPDRRMYELHHGSDSSASQMETEISVTLV